MAEIRLTIRRSPFRPDIDEIRLPFTPDKAVGYYLDDAGYQVPTGCWAGVAVTSTSRAKILDLDDWDSFVPDPGDLIEVGTFPGKGGGGGGKSIGQTITTIAGLALAFAAPATGPFAFLGSPVFQAFPRLTWGAVAGFGVSTLGGMLFSPTPAPLSSFASTSGGMAPSSPTYKIDDSGNQLQPNGMVPRPQGKFRWTPPLAAKSYREVQGKELFYRVLLTGGLGPVGINADLITIGETAMSEFKGVDYEIREGWDDDEPVTLFANDPWEDALDILLTSEDGWATRTTLTDVDEISCDFMCPRLTKVDGATSRSARTVDLDVQYAPAGTEDWQDAPWEDDGQEGFGTAGKVTITDNSTAEVWRGGRWKVATGQYKVRWRRTTEDSDDTSIQDQVHVTALRSIRYRDPIDIPGLSKIALRFKASNELQGTLPPVRIVTETYYNVYDEATGTWSYQITDNPAWAALDALMGPANPRPATEDQVDLDAFVDFAADCTERGFSVNGVIDYDKPVLDVFNDLAACGWGRFARNGTKYSVVWDRPVAAGSQHFTPHNTIAFELEKLLPKRPHALRISFINADKDYQRDVMTVYADGYNAEGTDGKQKATKFEEDEYHLITNPEHVWKTGTRKIAVSVYRDIDARLRTKMAHLVVREGMAVSATRPEFGWGLASGRVSVAYTSHVILSKAVPMEAGQAYSIAFTRDVDPEIDPAATRSDYYVLPKSADGDYTSVEFAEQDAEGNWVAADIPAEALPSTGTHFQFGAVDFVAKDFVISHIEHHERHQATLHMYPNGTEVFDAVAGTWPGYDSQVSDTSLARRRPDKPTVTGVVSDESVLVPLAGGGWASRLVVRLAPRSGEPFEISHQEVKYRRSDGVQWTLMPEPQPGDATQISIAGVQDGVAYDVDIKAVTKLGLVSDPAKVRGHVVVGQSTPPTDPEGLYVEKLPDGRFRYRVVGDTAIDHDGWKFRWQPGVNLQWAGSVAAHAGVHKADSIESAAFLDRTFTVLVKSVDVAGNESTGLAYAIVRLGDRVKDNWVDGTDYGAAAWPGTITGGSVVEGEVHATASTALYTDPAQPLFNDPSEALYSGYDTLVYEAALTVARKGFLAIDLDCDGAAVVEYRASGGTPLYTNPNQALFADPADPLFALGAWATYAGAFEVLPGTQYEIRVSIPGSPTKGVIRSLGANIEVPTDTEVLDDRAIDAAGTRLPTAAAAAEILAVGLTIQQAAGYAAVRAEVVDKDPGQGALVQCFDASNQPTAGLVDATIQFIRTI